MTRRAAEEVVRVRGRMTRVGAALAAVAALGSSGVAASSRHTIQPGETLSALAGRYGVSVAALVQANHLANPNRIVAGTVILVPGQSSPTGGRYTVRRGDTVSGIAASHGVTVAALVAANRLSSAHRILVGQTLTIPPGGSPAHAAAAPAPGSRHRVTKGENLTTIARRYGISVDALARANGITHRDTVVVGTTLKVPTAAPSYGSTGPAGQLPIQLLAQPDRQALIPVFKKWAKTYGTPADLLMAMTWLESGWQNGVVSPVGAVGIGQLMPDTVDFMRMLIGDGRLSPKRREDNIRMSARYLRWLLDHSSNKASTAVAAYYQGLASVKANGPGADTRAYVADVLALRDRHF